jgi:hypothetical protein
VPDLFQYREGGHHIDAAVEGVIADGDQINLDEFVMAMGNETPAVPDVEQTMGHAVSTGKTNFKAHNPLDTRALPLSPEYLFIL